MPIKIIRQDITKIECDAIVNPTNTYMFPGGGADAAIHEAAGPELFEFCRRLGTCPVGEARITPAFNLPCKYVIHTVGPEWFGGSHGEEMLLRSCYRESIRLAIENRCESVAFPLISSGLYGYPKDRVLRVAVDVIGELLSEREMEVFLLVYDKTAFSISKILFDDVKSYVDNFYVEAHSCLDDVVREREYFNEFMSSMSEPSEIDHQISREISYSECSSAQNEKRELWSEYFESLDDMLLGMDKGFAETLFHYIDKKGITDVECYKRSNVGKKTFSKIKCNRDYRPSKITAVSFAIGLHLDLEETRHLLSTAGMCLSRSSKFDVIIEYFIRSGNYGTIFDVNEVLYQFDQPLLGV